MNIELPQEKLAEKYVLGEAINDNNCLMFAVENLNDDDFFDPNHQILFSTLKEMYKLDITINTQNVCLRYMSHEIKGLSCAEILSLSMMSASIDYIYYISEIKNMSIKRKIISVCNKGLIDASKKESDPIDLLSKLHQSLDITAGNDENKAKSIKEIVSNIRDGRSLHEEALFRKKNRDAGVSNFQGVSSGYPILDATLGSFQNGGLYYIGARSSMGKTTFMLNLIYNMLNKYRIGLFSLEMDESIITTKIGTIIANLKYNWFSSGTLSDSQTHDILQAEVVLNRSNLIIQGPAGLTIQMVKSRAKRFKQKYNIDIIFIDYLTLIKPTSNNHNKHLEVDEISKGLQHLAKELKIPIICFAQLNRTAAKKDLNSKSVLPPTLTDFRESGSIEEDCDGAIFLHRPDYYNSDSDKKGEIQVIIAKNRLEGTLKNIKFHCDSLKSERYMEKPDVEQMVKEINEPKTPSYWDK